MNLLPAAGIKKAAIPLELQLLNGGATVWRDAYRNQRALFQGSKNGSSARRSFMGSITVLKADRLP
jgi:hypothetical protein